MSAYLVVVAIALALLALLVWGLHRLAGAGGAPRRPRREPPPSARELAGTHAELVLPPAPVALGP